MVEFWGHPVDYNESCEPERLDDIALSFLLSTPRNAKENYSKVLQRIEHAVNWTIKELDADDDYYYIWVIVSIGAGSGYYEDDCYGENNDTAKYDAEKACEHLFAGLQYELGEDFDII